MAGDFQKSLPESWQVCRLDEVATIIDSLHKTPIYSASGNAMVRVTDVQGGFLDLSKSLRVTEDVFQEFTRRYTPKRGDIVFSRVGSYGNASYANTDTPFCLGQNTALISPQINGRFLHLFLQSAEAKWQIEQMVVGSTQKTISLKSISALQIPVPPPDELEAIAFILGTLDDKIELNRRMNATLEAMARALFQSWFVDFDPVRAKLDGRKPAGMDEETAALFPSEFQDSELGQIPRGWEVRNLDQIAKFLNGLALQKFPPDEGPIIPVIKIGQLRKGDCEGADYCSAELPDEFIVHNGDLLFSWSGSLEVDFWCGGIGALNQHLFKVTSEEFPKWFYYLWTLNHLENFRFIAASKATTMGHIQRKHLSEAKVIIPNGKLLPFMDRKLEPLISKIIANRIQSQFLAGLRDILLPKLLSGEISVSSEEVKRAVNA